MSNSQYFPPCTESETITIILDLSNCATQKDLSNLQVKTSDITLKTSLASLTTKHDTSKTKVDKLVVNKLVVVPNDLDKLSKEVQAGFTKKTDFNTLKTKVDGIDTTKFVSKTQYGSEVGDLKLKIPDISGLLQTSTFNSKITEIEGKMTTAEDKILDIGGLATKTDITTVEGKIPDISGLANKTEVTSVENKFPDVNSFVKKKTNRLCNRN